MAESKSDPRTLIVIPARIGSTRLKEKPLRLIGGVSLIEHVCRRALEADVGPVMVSTDSERVYMIAPRGVVTVISTNFIEHCGSDRVAYEAEKYPGYDYIINLQGDMPFIFPGLIQQIVKARQESSSDIVTAAALIKPVVIDEADELEYFRVSHLQHIGIYAYTRESLKRFAGFPLSDLESRYGLEQFRAIENGMSFELVKVDHAPLEINTEADLFHANTIADAIWCTEDARSRD